VFAVRLDTPLANKLADRDTQETHSFFY